MLQTAPVLDSALERRRRLAEPAISQDDVACRRAIAHYFLQMITGGQSGVTILVKQFLTVRL
jgi:hypothetical protein